MDVSIEKLTTTVVGPRVTDAARTRLEVVDVSHIINQKSLMLIDDDSKIWRNWKVMWPPWLGIGILTILIWMRIMGSNGDP